MITNYISSLHRPTLTAVVLLTLMVGPTGAATITVNGTCTLIDAITSANSDSATGGCPSGSGDDVIELTGDVTLTTVASNADGYNGLPSMTSTIIINGHNHIIKRSSDTGTPSFRLLHVGTSGNLTLNAVSLQNGQLTGTGIPSDVGGGLFNRGHINLMNSTISGNSAAAGGAGIVNYYGGVTSLTNSTVSGNTGGFGAGIINLSSLTLMNSTVSGNTTNPGSGGGIWNNATLALTNSTITGNRANMSGSIELFIGGYGGGIDNPSPGMATLVNVTISNNVAAVGGGIAGGVTLQNTIVAGNSTIQNAASDCSGQQFSQGYNLIGVDSGCSGVTNGNNGDLVGTSTTPINPLLGALADNGGPTFTQALFLGSPAIDVIPLGVSDCGTVMTTDQRGVSRPQGPTGPGGNCDIGAFELVQKEIPSIEPVINFFDAAVAAGTLQGAGPAQSAGGRLNAVRNQLLAAGTYIDQGEFTDACGQLAATLKHINTGGTLQPDQFITGSSATDLVSEINALRQQLNCK